MVQLEFCPDGVGGRCQNEELGVPVGGGNVAGDDSFEVLDRAEDASQQTLPRELGEEAFDRMSQEQEFGVKWKVQRG